MQQAPIKEQHVYSHPGIHGCIWVWCKKSIECEKGRTSM